MTSKELIALYKNPDNIWNIAGKASLNRNKYIEI